ncbi:MAG: alginate export family protein, partial [Planctomycetales bacterium]
NLFAGAGSAGVGYLWGDACWKPQLWFTYDYASGDANPGQGNSFNTFQQMFPFGHYYFGYLDIVGRQNIHDFHTQFVMYPTPWITFLSQFHHFQLDSARSPLFGAAGAPIRQDPTGAAGKDVGNEIDFLVNFHLGAHQDVLVGYSKLFAGGFIEKTGNPGSPELFYLQHQYRW